MYLKNTFNEILNLKNKQKFFEKMKKHLVHNEKDMQTAWKQSTLFDF